MSEKEIPTISIEDFMSLEEAKPGESKTFTDEEYLAEVTTEEARNAAFIAQELGVTPSTVERRMKKLTDKILTKYLGNDPFFVLKPTKKKAGRKKASQGVEL